MNIKVCGVTSMKQMLQLDGMGVDFAGMVFDKQSSYYLNKRIVGQDLVSADLDIKKVGVFVNAGVEEIMEIVDEFGLDMVQLEGAETPQICEELSEEIEVIKTIFIDHYSAEEIGEMLKDYDEVCDYYSFDTVVKKDFGGITEKFDWDKIAGNKIEKPFFVGGGIKPSDAAMVKKFKHPDFYGVNLHNYFEKEPGVIDMALVLGFMRSVKPVK